MLVTQAKEAQSGQDCYNATIIMNLKNAVRTVGAAALSWSLVAVDWSMGSIRRLGRSVTPFLPSIARLVATGALLGGCVAGAGMVMARYAELFAVPVAWQSVWFVWGIAMLCWSIAA